MLRKAIKLQSWICFMWSLDTPASKIKKARNKNAKISPGPHTPSKTG